MTIVSLSLSCIAFLLLLSVRHHFRIARKEWHAELAAVRDEVSQLAARAKDAGPPLPPAPSFNLNRRPDAVRRLRGGQSYEAVAAATGWTAPEVALLQKIETLVSQPRQNPGFQN